MPISSCRYVHFAHIAGRRSGQETIRRARKRNKELAAMTADRHKHLWAGCTKHSQTDSPSTSSDCPIIWYLRCMLLFHKFGIQSSNTRSPSENLSNSNTSTGSSIITTAWSAVACATMSSIRVPVRSRKQVLQNRIGRIV
jgi:hypothetical protein